MKNTAPKTILLSEYRPPEFFVQEIRLSFSLHEDHAEVLSQLLMQRNPNNPSAQVVLDGEKLELLGIKVDGKPLAEGAYHVSDTALSFPAPEKESFSVEIRTRIKPQENLTLEGLYKSKGMFCTQCEAQGFRKITYYPDRPDVMALFTTTIEADKEKYPVLLSNGNLVEKKDLGNGRHMAVWKDPFKKPAYLYALVAGDLGRVEDHFVTKSGRRVKLEIFVDKGNEDRTQHAMESLKKSMKWDEDTFGLEYDLDIFMIVAVDDFNFGAMENKGLNIFNSNYVLAKPSTATDSDYENIEAIVAHEYFHNWTGNRVTCRDWFQLSLKEGLTVYRDQEFSSDMMSRAVCRIDNVNRLRQLQFPEDAGPMAHPIRPSSYMEINNFYTATVYEKGSEVIRMIATILGKEGFRKGIDKYFELYDGMAVTTEDFVHAMESATGVNLTQFRESWYEQAGTPELTIKGEYDAKTKRYCLSVAQFCPPTPGQPKKKPFHIPLALALLNQEGRVETETLVELKKESETFEFQSASEPVPSLLRGFSAPVKVKFNYSRKQLLHLLANDNDPFARWEAGQTLMLEILQDLIGKHAAGKDLAADAEFLEVLGKVAEDKSTDPALKAQLLSLPDENYIGQQQPVVLVDSVHAARNFLQSAIATHNEGRFLKLYQACDSGTPYRYTAKDVGLRTLKAAALSFLTDTAKPAHVSEALRLLKEADNMTDEMAGLMALIHHEGAEREEAFHHFYQKWSKETLVMNKWLKAQAVSSVPGGLERLKRVMNDSVFNINNPNKVYSLLIAFGRENPAQFHGIDGAAYRLFADLVLDIDSRNPSVAARLVSLFNQWKRFDPKRQGLMKEQLERIAGKEGVSAGVYEIASKALK